MPAKKTDGDETAPDRAPPGGGAALEESGPGHLLPDVDDERSDDQVRGVERHQAPGQRLGTAKSRADGPGHGRETEGCEEQPPPSGWGSHAVAQQRANAGPSGLSMSEDEGRERQAEQHGGDDERGVRAG